MSANSTGPPLKTYGAIWGPSLISVYIAAVIYGITVLQTFYYYSHYGRRDRVSWLILVAVIFILDTAAMALMMAFVYYYVVLSWGMPEMLLPDVKEGPTEYTITAVLTFVVQGFYINTIRALRAPPVATVVLLLTSVIALGTGLILPLLQLHFVEIQTIVDDSLNHIAFNIARGTALACDLGIVAALCWLLEIRKTSFRRANNVLTGLMIFAVQRGILQALVQGGEVIAYAVKPSSIYFIPFHIIVSRIYCLSVLATLNSREYVLSRGMTPPERERRRMKDNGRLTTLSFAAARRSGAEERSLATIDQGGIWASTRETSGPVLSSYLDPPFLFTASSRDMDHGLDIAKGCSCASGADQLSRREGSSNGALVLPPGILKKTLERPHSDEDHYGIEISGPHRPDTGSAYITAKSGSEGRGD